MVLFLPAVFFFGLLRITTSHNNTCDTSGDCPKFAECVCCWECHCIYGFDIYTDGKLHCSSYEVTAYVISCIVGLVLFTVFVAVSVGIYICLRRRRLRTTHGLTLIQTTPAAVNVPGTIVTHCYPTDYSVQPYQTTHDLGHPPPYTKKYGT